MRCVGINTLFIVPGRNRGVQTYLDNLVHHLAKRGRFQFKLFVSRANEDHYRGFKGVELVRCPVDGRNRLKRVLYEQLFLQSLAVREKCDLLFFPGYLSPVIKKIPFVVTIPDTQFRDIREMVPWSFQILYGAIVPISAKKADHVLTISEFSKKRIQHHLGLSGKRITVAHLAAEESLIRHITADREKYLEESGLKALGFDPALPYLISVSSANPHKNVNLLVRAFDEFNLEGRFQLVLVGVKRTGDPEAVFSTGFVSNEVRDFLYQGAHGYVFASKYEGFGIPLLEAMAAGLPIASSNAASLPEVGGDACLYFDPDDLSEMTIAIQKLCEDTLLRDDLIKRGREQFKRFSWEKCAEVTESVFKEVLDTKSSMPSIISTDSY